MGKSERTKGRNGEAEVAAIYRAAGLEVRGLEGGGDHVVICGADGSIVLHSESKRQETARPWLWFAQARTEAPAGSIAVVAMRRNHSPWLGLLELERLAPIVAAAAWAIENGYTAPELEP